MRLKSEVWVKAFVRRCLSAGAFAAVVRHGDDDAGAIFIKVNRLDGTCRVYGPAAAGLGETSEERLWSTRLGGGDCREDAADAYLVREREFDPDIWVVEVEDREGRDLLAGWLAAD